MQGGKLKKSFSVACSKCGEKGHNYKTCKGAPSNPNWKPKTKKPKKKGGSSSQQLVVLPLSQLAPPPVDSSSSQPTNTQPLQQATTVMSAAGPTHANAAPAPTRVTRSTLVIAPPVPTVTPFRPPTPSTTPPCNAPGKAREIVSNTSHPKPSKFRPKQKIFRPLAPLVQGQSGTTQEAAAQEVSQRTTPSDPASREST
ncbi:flocculation protein FLO11-like [Arachis duranensis]|uniref:Flocculation protein FLO11-like n=1 Tax=Arachis duranensis TaxID=130453 RepID=A0A6P4D355_ARADU|nr:flocculation protein FLO11-like [Arachis duranensis]